MFSKLDIKKLSLWLVIIMVCSFVIASSILATNGFDRTFFINRTGTGSHQIDTQKTFNQEGIKNISVNTTSTDINIIPVDSNEIKAHFYGTASSGKDAPLPELNAEVKGDRLSIEIKNKTVVNIGINFTSQSLKLDVFVPEAYSGNMNVNTVSGSAKIENLSIGSMGFSAVSGDLSSSNLRTKDSDISTTSGSVTLKQFEGNLKFNSVSGDLEAEYPVFNYNININTTSGDSKIYLPGQASFQIDFQSVSGDLKNDFSYSTINLDKRNSVQGVVNKGTNKITTDSTSGDVEIKRK